MQQGKRDPDQERILFEGGLTITDLNSIYSTEGVLEPDCQTIQFLLSCSFEFDYHIYEKFLEDAHLLHQLHS